MTGNKKADNISDFFVDDIKKKFGKIHEYIDEKVANVREVVAEVEKQGMSSCGAIIKEANDLKTSLADTSDNAFNAINMCKAIEVDLKRLMPSLDAIKALQEEIDCTRKEVTSSFSELSKEREREGKVLADFMGNVEKEINELAYSCDDVGCAIKEHVKKFDSLRPIVVDMTKELAELKNRCLDSKSQAQDMGHELTNLRGKIEDVVRQVNNNHVMVVTELGLLKGEMRSFVSRTELKDLEERLKRVEERPEAPVVKQSKDGGDFSSTWKEQMELKLSRIERKINE
jgi:uncharacterized coiled-coil DUF342 family protein